MVQGQVVDTSAASEFYGRVLQHANTLELSRIGAALERKSAAMRALAGDDPAAMDSDSLRELLGWVFCTRRKVNRIFAIIEPGELAAGIGDLLSGPGGIAERYERFAGLLAELPSGIADDLPGELLHFLQPGRYWLWTRWMWDPTAETGALALVTTEETDLGLGASPGETYLAVGQAVAFVTETGKAAGFTDLGNGLFGTDVFLAAVYAVYLQTVLSMRMTQEFTKMLPDLPELVRRLLGVHYPLREPAPKEPAPDEPQAPTEDPDRKA